MNNSHPDSAHLQTNQPKLILAQTHRVIQCDASIEPDIAVDTDHGKPQQRTSQQLAEKTATSRWQQLLQGLKKIMLPGLLTISAVLVPQVHARDVSISVQGQVQPGLYGHIQLGRPAVTVYHQPVYHQPVYQQPVYVQQGYAPQTVYIQPVLVQAPKKHRKHWKKYCHHYGVCQQRVQFVEVDYRPRTQYEKVYVYRDRDSGRREEKRHYHSHRH